MIAGLTVVENHTAVRTALARLLADQPPAAAGAGQQPGTGGGEPQPGGGDAADRTAPALGRVTLAPARFAVARGAPPRWRRRGAARRSGYALSEPAAVTLRVERLARREAPPRRDAPALRRRRRQPRALQRPDRPPGAARAAATA